MTGKRPALALLGAGLAVGQVVVAFMLAGRKCGAECEVSKSEALRPGVQWWQDENAWQWTGQAWIAAANAAIVFAACGFYLRGRERATRIVTPIGGVLFALWAAAVQPAIV